MESLDAPTGGKLKCMSFADELSTQLITSSPPANLAAPGGHANLQLALACIHMIIDSVVDVVAG